jgi:hypothetical protein
MFQVVRSGTGTAPVVRYLTSTGAFIRGDVLIYDTGLVKVAGADPTAIVGVAMQAYETAPGYNQANSPTVNTYRASKVCVAAATREATFRGKMTNGSSTRVAAAVTDIGISYGITAYSGVWTVDKNKTAGDIRVRVVGFDDLTGDAFFKFLEAAITPNP